MRKSSASQDVGLGTGKNLASASGGRLTPSLMGGFASRQGSLWGRLPSRGRAITAGNGGRSGRGGVGGVAEATAKEGIDHRAPGDMRSTFTTDQTSVAARDIFKGRSVMHNKMAHQTVDC